MVGAECKLRSLPRTDLLGSRKPIFVGAFEADSVSINGVDALCTSATMADYRAPNGTLSESNAALSVN